MKKVLHLAVLSLFCSGTIYAANPFEEFEKNLKGEVTSVAQSNLDNFAKDLGALIGGGSFHEGKALGLPGFDVGIHISAKKVGEDNKIIKETGLETVPFPILQVEIALPAKINLIGRYVTYNDSTLIGMGARYGIFKSPLPGVPSVSVQAIINNLDVQSGLNKLKATTISAAAVASFGLPIVNPYVGVGMDTTSVVPDASIVSDLKGNASQLRVEAGINLSLIPFTYVQLGGVMTGGDIGYTFGLGISF